MSSIKNLWVKATAWAVAGAIALGQTALTTATGVLVASLIAVVLISMKLYSGITGR
jgi:uncharacterized protein (DUF2062 family)